MSSDRISLVGLQFYSLHGADPSEREFGQRFEVDLELQLDLSPAGRSDALADALDYRLIYQAAARVMAEPCNLLEAVAERLAASALALGPVEAVTVRVRKPSVPIGGVLAYAQVQITRLPT